MSDYELARKLYQACAPDHTLDACGDETRARWIIVAIRARKLLAGDQPDQPDAGRVTLWRNVLTNAITTWPSRSANDAVTYSIALANAAVEADRKRWGGQ